MVFRAHGFLIYKKPTQTHYDSIFTMLKPGGLFGIIDHRGDQNVLQDPDGKKGYVNQLYLIMMAEKSGFMLMAKSEINANPSYTKDYSNGRYLLPPSLKGSSFNQELREKVLTIGESDRMTLTFIKPE